MTNQHFSSLVGKEGSARAHRWGLESTLKVRRFKFSGRYTPSAEIDFVNDFMTSAAFSSELELGSKLDPEDMARLEIEKVPATVLNMGFFDFLENEGLIAANGYLKKCMNDRVAGVDIDTLVTDLLINEESEHLGAISEAKRAEFIFQLFHLIFIGGAMHQRDESVIEYLETAKALYKELLTVHKKAESGKIEITSKVYQIKIKPCSGSKARLFSGVEEHSRCFLVVDPVKRYATVVFSDYKSFW